MPRTLELLLLLAVLETCIGYNPFFALPKVANDKPKLILIAGCPGTVGDKSDFHETY